jgi:hypothetical protein
MFTLMHQRGLGSELRATAVLVAGRWRSDSKPRGLGDKRGEKPSRNRVHRRFEAAARGADAIQAAEEERWGEALVKAMQAEVRTVAP